MAKLSNFKLRKEQKAQAVNREQLVQFAEALNSFLQQIENNQSEEEQKNFLQHFLETTFYAGGVVPGTKTTRKGGTYDLVIYPSSKQETIEVLIEVKSTSNSTEMITPDDLNRKALQQLLIYYLRERAINDNKQLRHLVVTNLHTFFCFDAAVFYETFYRDLEEKFRKIEEGRGDISKSQDLYVDFASPAIEKVKGTLPYDYIDLREYRDEIQEVLNNKESAPLTELYKFFSPFYLLKQPIQSDPNQLDRGFYNELLYLLGLEEQKSTGNKVRIARAKEPHYASLIEQTYGKVELAFEHFTRREQYGATEEEQKFNIALELVITWLNRLLFLKLLETQLLNYNASNNAFLFLNKAKLRDFTALNNLFFAVLAIPPEKRSNAFKERFGNVPYLNSALFEETELEHEVKISELESQETLPFYTQSVLKKEHTNTADELPIFDYLFAFLDAYDFGSQDETTKEKTLVNASVLGLIFEKINGHKDGAVFTPSYITTYICRETIERAIVDKFNTQYGWQCADVKALYNQLDVIDKQEANALFDTITICDPAVGSGHFLVSALNELIYLKHRLGILQDASGTSLRRSDYEIEIVCDELLITAKGAHFSYTPKNPESQRVQETLFSEKRHLIEHCLFGVDINPTSVQICRLRLWIELLKHAYYTRESDYQALETLPNIDINIKCGNAIVYSLPLQGKWVDPDSQRIRALTSEYYETSDKSRKRAIALAIEEYNNTLKNKLWEEEKRTAQERVEKCEKEIATLSKRLEASKNNEWSAYEPSELKALLNGAKAKYKEALQAAAAVEQRRAGMRTFEWRLEFPEVWDANGEFAGFDIVLGNPPYIKEYENKQAFANFKTTSPYYMGKMDLWYGFLCVGLDLLREGGLLCFIATNNWTTSTGAKKMRERILEVATIRSLIDFNDYMVFENASIQTMILLLQHCSLDDKYLFDYRKLITNKASYTDAIAMLENRESGSILYLRCEIEKSSLCKNFTLTENKDGELLSRINNGANHLYESEAINGIHPHYDFVNNNIALKHPTLRIGQGIFGLSEQEKDNLCLTNNELTLIKPYYTTEQIKRYVVYPRNRFWLIYTTSSFKNPDSMDSYPNIKRHLNLFRDVITSDNKPYGLHRARNEAFFLGEKIICQRKCVGAPSFSYADFPTYVSATFYVIKTERFNLKFLTGLLNSKLIAYWLRHKGKMQGSNFQIDKDPLLQIPIKSAKEIDKQIIEQVERILQAKQTAPDADIHVEEKRIDSLVYRLYGLNDSDIAIIENEG